MANNLCHVLSIPAWLPTEASPHTAPFIPFQVRTLAQLEGIKSGLIFRRNSGSTKADPLLKDLLQDIPSVVVEAPRVRKVNGLAIKVWVRAYRRAFDTYVSKYGRPDILHAHSFNAGFAALDLSRYAGIPYVMTEHATILLSDGVRRFQRPALRRVLNNASGLIAVSEALRGSMSYYTRKHIDVVPNMYDDSIFKSVERQYDTGSLIAVGNLIRRKGFHNLIAAIAQVETNAVMLHLVGNGPERPVLEQQVQSLGLAKRVKFYGGLDAHQIARLAQGAQLFVSPSLNETFGIAIVESMACGTPVVSTPSAGPAEFCNELNSVVTNGFDPESIADAIQQALSHHFDRNAIANFAEQNYSRSVVAKKIISIYERILDSRN